MPKLPSILNDGHARKGSTLASASGHRLWVAVRILVVRFRFLLFVGLAILVVSQWDRLRNHWDTVSQLRTRAEGSKTVTLDTEYWCPMCPGVVSDWPAKCPVCNMALVQRKRGEAVPLPNGVLARMQLSPYRIQLAGIKTARAEYQALDYQVVLGGRVEPADKPSDVSRVVVQARVLDQDLVALEEGLPIEATCDAFPHAFTGRLGKLSNDKAGRLPHVRVEIDNPKQELRPGMYVSVRVKMPAARSASVSSALRQELVRHMAAWQAVQTMSNPARPSFGLTVGSLAEFAEGELRLQKGLVLAVPESAIVDTGSRQVVYVESMPGMFDAVEVALAPRCGEFYPVLRGLEPGQRVVIAGALLVDAETRLNPSVAASYFGAARTAGPATETSSPPTLPSTDQLSPADRLVAAEQKVCPVTGEPLDSMGGPIRVEIEGHVVFLCCKGCEPALRKNPAKYLAKLRHE